MFGRWKGKRWRIQFDFALHKHISRGTSKDRAEETIDSLCSEASPGLTDEPHTEEDTEKGTGNITGLGFRLIQSLNYNTTAVRDLLSENVFQISNKLLSYV